MGIATRLARMRVRAAVYGVALVPFAACGTQALSRPSTNGAGPTKAHPRELMLPWKSFRAGPHPAVRVAYPAAPCELPARRVALAESDSDVRVTVFGRRPGRNEPCVASEEFRCSLVALAAPLGNRKLVDGSGQHADAVPPEARHHVFSHCAKTQTHR